MSGDLVLKNRQPGDLELRRDRVSNQASADLYLQSIANGDLLLKRPPERQADLHASLPSLVSSIEAHTQGVSTADLHGTLPPLQSQLKAEYALKAQLHAVLPGLVSSLEANYDNAVWRGIESRSDGVFEKASPRTGETSATHKDSFSLRNITRTAWQTGANRRGRVESRFEPMVRRYLGVCSKNQDGKQVARETCNAWETMDRRARQGAGITWETTAPVLTGTCPSFKDLSRKARPKRISTFQEALLSLTHWCGDYRDGKKHRLEYCWDWQEINLPVYGWGGAIIIPTPPPPPFIDPCSEYGQADLLLLNNRDSVLVLSACISEGLRPKTIIPIKRVYLMLHTIEVVRDSDNLPIDVKRLQLSLDVDSWAWGFSGQLVGKNALDAVIPSPDPVILRININGYIWKVLVEDWSESREFGRRGVNVRGRGLSAQLAAPYEQRTSGETTSSMSLQQVLNNHLPIGSPWSIVWETGTPDWTIPAGARNWQQQDPITAIHSAATGVGLIVVPARDTQTLTVKPRYPVYPWDFNTATPDVVIPESAILSVTRKNVIPTQANTVFVHGSEIGGIVMQLTRQGTAGDLPAKTQSHQLITDVAGGRLLGGRILAAHHQQPTVQSIAFPLGGNFPLLDLGNLVQVDLNTSERGLVSAVNISVAFDNSKVSVRQEVHLGENTPNQLVKFRKLLPEDRLLMGTVTQVNPDGTVHVTLLDGSVYRVRGSANVNDVVYIRGGKIDGVAPSLPSYSDVI